MSYPYIYQYLDIYATQPDTVWKNDIILDTPVPLAPGDSQTVCPRSNGSDSNIVLQWSAISGATKYVLQFALNSSFQGPTVKSILVSNNYYNLQLISDIRIGDELHWRVAAIDEAGGVSDMSSARKCKFECPALEISADGSGETGGPPSAPSGTGNMGRDNCRYYNVNVEIIGPSQTMCCDVNTFRLKSSWDCSQDGLDLATLVSVNWAIVQNPADSGTAILSQDAKSCEITSDCENSQLAKIVVTLNFNSPTGTFSCNDNHEFYIDCDTGKPDRKPWLQGGKLVYSGKGMQTYLDPDYWAETIAPAYGMTTLESTEGVFVMYPPTSVGDPYNEFEGDDAIPDGVPVTHAIAQGPVAKFGTKEFDPEPIPSTNPGCYQYQGAGYPEGEKHEARAHVALSCGLKKSQFGIQVNNQDLVGQDGFRRGLKKFGACSLEIDYGCGLNIREEQLIFDRRDVFGKGFTIKEDFLDCCRVDAYLGDGLKFGDTFAETDACKDGSFSATEIEADVDCGLYLHDGKIKIDFPAIAGRGLYAQGCSLYTDSYGGDFPYQIGCGLMLDTSTDPDTLEVSVVDLAGPIGTGISFYNSRLGGTDCPYLKINTDCHLYIDPADNDALTLDVESLAQPTYATGINNTLNADCNYLYIKAGCGLDIYQPTNTLKIDEVKPFLTDTWWSIVPDSMQLSFNDCGIYLEFQRQGYAANFNSCGVMFGPLVNMGLYTENHGTKISEVHTQVDVLDCNDECITLDLYRIQGNCPLAAPPSGGGGGGGGPGGGV